MSAWRVTHAVSAVVEVSRVSEGWRALGDLGMAELWLVD